MTNPAPEPIIHIPAATVIIFRQPAGSAAAEILMVQRSNEMRFAGGAAVFPGGKVDEADRDLAATLTDNPGLNPDETAARIAGIRETLEETGLAIGLAHPVSAQDATRARQLLLEGGALGPVLAEMGWRLSLAALVPFARWRPSITGTFDTRFYLADLGTGAVDISVDATENTRLFWITPKQAVARARADDLHVIFPTLCNLERLAQFTSHAQTRAHAEATPVEIMTATIRDIDGERWLTIAEGQGYPLTRQRLDDARRGFRPPNPA